MKNSRWIAFPLIYSVIYIFIFISYYLFVGRFSYSLVFEGFILGVFTAFLQQYFCYKDARAISDDVRVFDHYQNRNFTVLLDYEKAFSLCKEVLNFWEKHEIIDEDTEKGVIISKIRYSKKWYERNSEEVRFKVKKINEDFSEIDISLGKKWRNIAISSGYTWWLAEGISDYIKTKDAEINKKVIADSALILDEIYAKPFQKQTQV